jgi:hypothetical protein
MGRQPYKHESIRGDVILVRYVSMKHRKNTDEGAISLGLRERYYHSVCRIELQAVKDDKILWWFKCHLFI